MTPLILPNSRALRVRLKCSAFLLVFFVFSNANAWGERGHDLITRVAVQQLVTLSNSNLALTRPFVSRDHMLSHLSNAPDIVWRSSSMSELERQLNNPTHYISLERALLAQVPIQEFAHGYQDYKQALVKGSPSHAKLRDVEIGSAPWRVLQLYKLMVTSFSQIHSTKDKELQIELINRALLYAGLMSHFVGDLANPHHTSVNYDGQLSAQKGLHAYFESDIVSVLPLGLIDQVYRASGTQLLWQTILSPSNDEQDNVKVQDKVALKSPSHLIFALISNSNENLSELNRLDRKHSLIRESDHSKAPAQRKKPDEVAHLFKPFVVERLAIGASVLSQLWYAAWLEADSPDLSGYHSYHYHLAPEFIVPDYMRISEEEIVSKLPAKSAQ